MASIINLNNICKIVLKKKEKSYDFEWVTTQTFSQWFMNLFRKDKLTTSYVRHYPTRDYYISTDIEKDLLGEHLLNKKLFIYIKKYPKISKLFKNK